MTNFVLFLQFFVLCTILLVCNLPTCKPILAQVHGDETLYPDWSCHPGYNPSTDGEESGQGWIEYAMGSCKDKECYKSCIYPFHRITDWDSKDMQPEVNMASRMQSVFNNYENDSAKKIAHAIVSNCSEIVKNSESLLCNREFEECVEKAWAC